MCTLHLRVRQILICFSDSLIYRKEDLLLTYSQPSNNLLCELFTTLLKVLIYKVSSIYYSIRVRS